MEKICKICSIVLNSRNKELNRRSCKDCELKRKKRIRLEGTKKEAKCKKCFVALDESNRYKRLRWCKTCGPTKSNGKKRCKTCLEPLTKRNAAPGRNLRCKGCWYEEEGKRRKKRRKQKHYRLWENCRSRWDYTSLEDGHDFLSKGYPRLTAKMVPIMLKAWDNKSVTGRKGKLMLEVVEEYVGFSPYGVAPFTVKEMREADPCPIPEGVLSDPKVKKKFLLIADVCCGKKPESVLFQE